MNKSKILFASIVGNALESFDFVIYGILASVIAKVFFVSTDPIMALLASWGAFAAGFVMRPLGALIFGHIGDKWGRKKALTLSVMGMGIPTLVIGLTPSYATAGIISPIILFLCRLTQGFSVGGECNGAGIYALEQLNEKRPGLVSGIFASSTIMGMIIATGTCYMVMRDGMPAWGWRLPFILGGSISFIGVYIRRKLNETPAFERIEKKHKIPVIEAVKENKRAMLAILAFAGAGASFTYLIGGFFTTYIHQFLGIELQTAIRISMISLIVFGIFCPIGGHIYDKVGRNI